MVIDTNRYRDFADGVAGVVRRFQEADRILVPFVVPQIPRIHGED